jgi:hypothetical protein
VRPFAVDVEEKRGDRRKPMIGKASSGFHFGARRKSGQQGGL